jgi:hypothetical protein
VVDGGASTSPDHVEAFPNDVSKGLAAYPVSVRISHFIALRSLGDVRSLEHSANLCPVDTRGLATDQKRSATQSRRQRPSAIPEYLSSLLCSRVCLARKSSRRPSPSDFVRSRSKVGPQVEPQSGTLPFASLLASMLSTGMNSSRGWRALPCYPEDGATDVALHPMLCVQLKSCFALLNTATGPSRYVSRGTLSSH